MKKSIIAAVFIVFLLLLVFFPLGNMVIRNEPIIEVQSVKITEITWSTMGFDVILAITNPYPIEVTVTELTYTITTENSGDLLVLATGTREGMGDLKVAGSSITDILIPAQMYNNEAMAAGIEFLTQGGIDIIVSGSAKVDLKVFQPEIPFSKKFTLTRDELLLEMTGTKDLIHDIKSEIQSAGMNIALKLLFPS
ncbi:MAG: LEA type 2 family protein [Methanomicrobiales archaeon]|nr:LEA type 2 family protein [Methanomicrobiales archaeon]